MDCGSGLRWRLAQRRVRRVRVLTGPVESRAELALCRHRGRLLSDSEAASGAQLQTRPLAGDRSGGFGHPACRYQVSWSWRLAGFPLSSGFDMGPCGDAAAVMASSLSDADPDLCGPTESSGVGGELAVETEVEGKALGEPGVEACREEHGARIGPATLGSEVRTGQCE